MLGLKTALSQLTECEQCAARLADFCCLDKHIPHCMHMAWLHGHLRAFESCGGGQDSGCLHAAVPSLCVSGGLDNKASTTNRSADKGMHQLTFENDVAVKILGYICPWLLGYICPLFFGYNNPLLLGYICPLFLPLHLSTDLPPAYVHFCVDCICPLTCWLHPSTGFLRTSVHCFLATSIHCFVGYICPLFLSYICPLVLP